MPSRTLPTLARAEVQSHNSEISCYVTLGDGIYDLTDFIHSHPGGTESILEYAGKDVRDILEDASSHSHSRAAYEVLHESLIAFIISEQPINGMGEKAYGIATETEKERHGEWVYQLTNLSYEEYLSKETNYSKDYQTHKFLDLSRPLLPQIWFGGFSKEFYLDQVHRPRHCKGGESAQLFGNFLEPLSKTFWWVIPTLWLPPVIYGVYISRSGLNNAYEEAAYFMLGLFLWTLIEYILHRALFHIDEYLPDNRVSITLHFLLHGIHHYLPMDRHRLVMPPVLFVFLASPFWNLVHAVIYNWSVATSIYCGGIFGYICYDLTHYFLHHHRPPLWYQQLKKHHLRHHFQDYKMGFGVTTRFWDQVFGTNPL